MSEDDFSPDYDLILSYVELLYKDITGLDTTCKIKMMKGTNYIVIEGNNEKEKNLLMNLVNTLKLMFKYLSEEELELEEETGCGSKYKRGGTSYLTH